MEFTLEDTVRHDSGKDYYWARISVLDGEGNQGKALVGASANYICDHLGLYSGSDIKEEHLTEWISQVIAKLRRDMPEVKAGHIYYQVDSFTEDGVANGLEFLREEVAP